MPDLLKKFLDSQHYKIPLFYIFQEGNHNVILERQFQICTNTTPVWRIWIRTELSDPDPKFSEWKRIRIRPINIENMEVAKP